MPSRVAPTVAVSILLVATAGHARADGTPAGREPARSEHRLAWDPEWPRVHPVEAIVAGVLGSGTFLLPILVDSPREPSWRGGILLDDPFRGIRAGGRRARDRAGAISDIAAITLAAYPIVVDAVLVAGVGDGNADVAWQIGVIAAQAEAIAAFLAVVVKPLAARQRPYAIECADDP
ncbi:MAG: hypothetical protein IT379_00225, partial [Deltaproteobacteria bacterium]|nr:hypothetical protein [Deltaproteobacteria bacterium]